MISLLSLFDILCNYYNEFYELVCFCFEEYFSLLEPQKKKKTRKTSLTTINYYYFLFLRIENIRACLMFYENVLIF